jgi:TetR/AcrR family transcriptional regulator
MYLMISFMRILSLENRWKLVVEAERFSNEQFASGFFRFITLAISPGEKDRTVDLRDFESSGFFLTTTVQLQKKKKGKRK